MDKIKKEVDNYITQRYNRWLDYSIYHCTLAEMEEEAPDVLNEVLCMLLQKEYKQLQTLLHSKRGQYTDLDYYILQMIKLNVISDSSPYRHKYKNVPIDENIDWRQLDIIDEPDNEPDYAGETLKKIRLVREILPRIKVSPRTRQIFHYRFFREEPFSQWPGPETKKQLYNAYNKVIRLIREELIRTEKVVIRKKKLVPQSELS